MDPNNPVQGEETPPVEDVEAPSTDTQTEDNAGQGNEYSLSGDFLQNVPDDHREIVEQYVKKWDAGVTRRFQELHSQYKPYQELGDPETLQQAVEVYQLLENNPEFIYNVLAQEFGHAAAQQMTQGGEQGLGEEEENSFGDLPPEFVSRIDQQQQVLEALAEFVLGQNQQVLESQEDAELDSYINNLKTEFGEFDEEYVLFKMDSGMPGAEAVQQYQSMIQAQVNAATQAANNAPPVLSGGGTVPQDSVPNMGEIPNKDVRSLVESLIAQSNQE